MIARLRAAPIPVPAILAAVLIIQVFLNEGVSPYGALRSLLLATLLGLAIWLVAWALLRSPDRAAIVGALVVLALWNTPQWWMYLGAAVVVAVLPPVAERLTGRRLPWRAAAAAAVVFSLGLLVLPLVSWIGWGGPALLAADLRQGGGLDRLADAAAPASADPGASTTSNGSTTGSSPDIYLVLLDEHSRQDVLLRDFGVDDSAFVAALQQRGFTVSAGSHSNYDSTEYTLASMLQMQYLDSIPSLSAALARGVPIDAALRDLGNANPVFATLRAKGYTIVTTAPWFEHTIIRRSDVLVDSGLLNEFESQLLLSTTVGRILDDVIPSWLGDQFRGNIQANVSAAGAIAATPSSAPRLAFIHIAAPHEPYVFGADGSPQPLRITDLYGPYAGTDEQLAAKRAAYAADTQWVDGQAIAAVDSILASATRPSVVIVFGDHGSRLPVTTISSIGDSARVSNLFAALTPGHPGLFGESPTLVNVFPKLLDTYLGASVPLLPNRAYDYYPKEVEVPLPGVP